jgi:4,5-DOPA dioxygenase extradiol
MAPPPATESALRETPSIIQLSLPGDMSEESSERLGITLGKLRDQGYAIVATGQAVHNLRDLREFLFWLCLRYPSLIPYLHSPEHMRAAGGKGTPYGPPFLAAVMEAINSPVGEIGRTTKDLFEHRNYKRAHPTAEHLLPLVVSAGAVQGVNEGSRADVIFEEEDGPLGWAMARWD